MTILNFKSSLTLLFLLVSWTFSIPLIAGPDKKDKKPKNQDPSLVEKKKSVAVAALIDAKRMDITGNPEKAIDQYRQIIEKFPEEAAAYFEMGRLLEEKNELAEALKCARKAVEIDPINEWYQLFLVEVLQMSGEISETIDVYKKLLVKSPDNLDYLYQLAALYLSLDKFNDAINIYNKIEIKIGITEQVSLQKQKIYSHLKDTDEALQELNALIKAYPAEMKYQSILAEFYLANKMPDKALETYKKIAKMDPNDPFIHMSLADYYKKMGENDKAFEELKLGFANPSMSADDKVKILLFFYTVDQLYKESKEQAFSLVEILVATHPNDAKSHSIYGDFLVQDNQLEKAREEFSKAANLDNARYPIWEQLLQLDMRLGKFEDLNKTSQQVIELFPEQPLPYLFSGIALSQLKDYEKAISRLTTGSKLVVNDDYILSQFYMFLGDAYHSLQKTEESDRAYEKSLSLHDSNATLLNNYSYYLTLRNEKLPKAEAMAKKAVSMEPDNPSFQDTYGWVLYKLGRYDEAKTWVYKAIQSKESPSGEVLEHYGDILFKLGEIGEALEFWKEAKAKGDASKFIDMKITEKKLYE